MQILFGQEYNAAKDDLSRVKTLFPKSFYHFLIFIDSISIFCFLYFQIFTDRNRLFSIFPNSLAKGHKNSPPFAWRGKVILVTLSFSLA